MKSKFLIQILLKSSLYALLLAGNAASVFSQSKPVIVTQPKGMIVPLGATVSFSVVADTNVPVFSYRWRFDGLTLIGETNSTLTVTNATKSGRYTVVLTNSVGGTISRTAYLSFFTAERVTNGIALNFDLPITGPGGSTNVFQLQYTTDWQSSNWTTLTNVSPCGCVVRYVDSTATSDPLRIYRGVLLE